MEWTKILDLTPQNQEAAEQKGNNLKVQAFCNSRMRRLGEYGSK